MVFIHDLGVHEVLIVLGLALVPFRANRLPGVARGIVESKRAVTGAATAEASSKASVARPT